MNHLSPVKNPDLQVQNSDLHFGVLVFIAQEWLGSLHVPDEDLMNTHQLVTYYCEISTSGYLIHVSTHLATQHTHTSQSCSTVVRVDNHNKGHKGDLMACALTLFHITRDHLLFYLVGLATLSIIRRLSSSLAQ